MRSRDFCYWLQGYFELTDSHTLSNEQIKVIRDHLDLVFAHEIDPLMGDKSHQKKLNEIHNSSSPDQTSTMRC